jgi:hypothetical protein
MQAKIEVSIERVVRGLAVFVAFLFLAHAGGLISTALGHANLLGWVSAFNVNREHNVPTWYSSMALGTAALLLFLIAYLKRVAQDAFAGRWLLLGIIFLLLSCDETALLHERSTAFVDLFVKNKFLSYVAWVVPAGIFLVVFGVGYVKFLLHLTPRFRKLFVVSGALYVMGAFGMELVTGALGRLVLDGKVHFLFEASEEVMEMTGVILFLRALLLYVKEHVGNVELVVR